MTLLNVKLIIPSKIFHNVAFGITAIDLKSRIFITTGM
jgi:hypothetical protein